MIVSSGNHRSVIRRAPRGTKAMRAAQRTSSSPGNWTSRVDRVDNPCPASLDGVPSVHTSLGPRGSAAPAVVLGAAQLAEQSRIRSYIRLLLVDAGSPTDGQPKQGPPAASGQKMSSHGFFDAASDQPEVGRPEGGEAEQHADLHQGSGRCHGARRSAVIRPEMPGLRSATRTLASSGTASGACRKAICVSFPLHW